MLKSLLFFIKFFLFWMVFFMLDRLSFLLINSKKLSPLPLSEISGAFYHALKLDLSMAAYLAVIPMLGYFYLLFSGENEVGLKWVRRYNRVLIVVFCIISVINFNIYREWGSKINAKALGFAITTPNEALASSASSPVLLSLLVFFVLLTVALIVHRWIMSGKLHFSRVPFWLKLALVIFLLFGNFLLIRGKLRGSPINQSMAYYSHEQVLNHAAVNTEWNLISTILASGKVSHNPYRYLPEERADQLVKELYAVEKDTTVRFLKTTRPNVVLFIIESFTADLTKTLGSEDGITPNFDRMFHEGVFFDQIYSTGTRTDKGLVGTLAGYPTLAGGSIVKWPEKMQKIPALSQSFFNRGYNTSFFYGGESEFDNYKAFILSHNYQKLVDKNNFKTAGKSPWGQFDETVLQRQLEDLGKEKQPFFSTMLTLTNHEPYVLPGSAKFGTADNKSKFKSTAYYTDSCLNAYLQEARKQPWYQNTLFVFIADHGHVLPKDRTEVFVPQRYHIPLLFYGPAIREEYQGKTISKVGSQGDVAATLLAQLDMPAKEFKWSKNLMNPYTKSFAFFSWDNGMGFINSKQCVTFDNVGGMVLFNNNKTDIKGTSLVLERAKAYLQSVYQQFIEL